MLPALQGRCDPEGGVPWAALEFLPVFVLLISKWPQGFEDVSKGSQGCHTKMFLGVCLFIQPQRLCSDPF